MAAGWNIEDGDTGKWQITKGQSQRDTKQNMVARTTVQNINKCTVSIVIIPLILRRNIVYTLLPKTILVNYC